MLKKLWVASACLLLTTGCAPNPPAAGSASCDSGATRACTCPDGSDSNQSCLNDGSGWQACLCDESPHIIQPTKQFPGALNNWCTGQTDNFSFFVTSMDAIWDLSETAPDDWEGGLGGDFQGLEGADSICQIIAIATGNGHKRWRAFLSATDDGQGNPVHAIERIGPGPWYDANGRLVSNNLDGLIGERPAGDPATVSDLPDECGRPISELGDAHDVPTASDRNGRLRSTNLESTCNDWTSSDPNVATNEGGGGGGGAGRQPQPTHVYCGHTFPRQGRGAQNGRGQQWLSDHPLRGCGKGAMLLQGPTDRHCIGCSGGYGGLYCFVEAE